jgi:hypothetical protein
MIFPPAQYIFISCNICIEFIYEIGESCVTLNQHQRFDVFYDVEIAAVGLAADFQHVDVGNMTGFLGVAGENGGFKGVVIRFQFVELAQQTEEVNLDDCYAGCECSDAAFFHCFAFGFICNFLSCALHCPQERSLRMQRFGFSLFFNQFGLDYWKRFAL